jgi:limonene-1,2-epoxide hydrolase
MKLVRVWVDAINRNDVESELSCWQPDAEYTIVATGATLKGIESFRRGGESSASLVSSQPVEGRKQITNLFANPEWACVEYNVNATVTGPIVVKNIEILPEGASRTIQLEVCIVFHIKNGKFCHGREYFDTATLGRQLGVNGNALADVYSSEGLGAGLPGKKSS